MSGRREYCGDTASLCYVQPFPRAAASAYGQNKTLDMATGDPGVRTGEKGGNASVPPVTPESAAFHCMKAGDEAVGWKLAKILSKSMSRVQILLDSKVCSSLSAWSCRWSLPLP